MVQTKANTVLREKSFMIPHFLVSWDLNMSFRDLVYSDDLMKQISIYIELLLRTKATNM